MPGATLPPRNTGTVGGAITRVERIERNTIAPPPTVPLTQIFTYPGGLVNAVESPPWYVSRSGLIESVRVSLTSNASTDHSVALRVNGTTQQTFTLSAGTKTVATTSAISVAYGDYVTILTVSVLDSNLAVEVRLR